MNKKQINSIGMIIFYIVLVILVFNVGSKCWIKNEGGGNWGSCGISIFLLLVVAFCTLWASKRIKKDNE